MKKTGIMTISLGLIVLGIYMILSINGMVSSEVISYIWPSLIILFGLEIVWNRVRHPDKPLQISGWSAVLLVLAFIISLTQTISPISFVWQPKYYSAVNGEVPIDNSIKRVEIRIPDGKIIVSGTNASVLSYDGELSTHESSQSNADNRIEVNWKVQKSGDTLELIYEEPNNKLNIFQFIQFGNFKPPVLNVVIPQTLLTKVQTKNGGVNITDMNADTDIKTSNGAITVLNLRGKVKAETSNGSLTVEQIEGAADVHTSNGTISLINISGPVTAATSNGTIKGSSPISGSWGLKTSNGKINLAIPENSHASFQAKTSNGSIGGDMKWIDEGKNKRSAVIGTGEHTAALSTSNGSINVNYQ